MGCRNPFGSRTEEADDARDRASVDSIDRNRSFAFMWLSPMPMNNGIRAAMSLRFVQSATVVSNSL